MMMGFIQRPLLRGKNIYVISYDIAAARDSVSHCQLMRALMRFKIDQRTRRLIHNWLRGREFREKFRTVYQDIVGQPANISAGLP